MRQSSSLHALCLATACIAAVSAANALDLNGYWVSSDYGCSGMAPPTELFQIADNGMNYQAVKVRGDPCVPAGAVSFFGSRGETPLCKMILGEPDQPASSMDDCALTVIDDNTITLNAFTTLSRVTNTGSLSSVAVSQVFCGNSTTGETVSGSIVNENSGWVCDALRTEPGDTVVEIVVGEAR